VIEVALDRHRGRARLRVTDSGPGIAPDVLPHVFERFRQAESSSRRRHEGLGLGLAIVRHLVETHGGTVRAENGADGGAIFTVELPLLAVRPRATEPAPGAEPAAAPVRLDGLSVLLVEDHADSRETIALTLESSGAEVTAVPAVADALAVLRERSVDLLVSDLGMPPRALAGEPRRPPAAAGHRADRVRQRRGPRARAGRRLRRPRGQAGGRGRARHGGDPAGAPNSRIIASRFGPI